MSSNSRPPVLVTCRIPTAALDPLRDIADVEVHERPAPLTPDELQTALRDKHGVVSVVTDRLDRAALDAAASLRVVANIAVGYDNIDVAYARHRGIVVTNTPDVLTESVAAFTWGLILAATRRISEGERLVRRGEWRGWALDFMLGMALPGKRLGIVGLGAIGKAVAKKAAAFGMDVAYASRSHRPPAGEGQAAWRRVSLDELLVSCDVVSLHVPLTRETTHLIDRKALVRMRRSAWLINTSRGPVVDEAALVWALEEGVISGAALDVFEHEPAVSKGLLALDNVLLVPHLGSATRETRTAMAELAVRNVVAVLQGRPAMTPVG